MTEAGGLCWLLPAANLGLLHCLPAQENVQFLLLFAFGSGDGRGSRTSQAVKSLWKAGRIFPLVPLKFLGRNQQQLIVLISFFLI